MRTPLPLFTALALVALTGCSRTNTIAVPKGAGPTNVVVPYLINHPATVEVVGLGPTSKVVKSDDVVKAGFAGIGGKRTKSETIALTGPKGTATLSYTITRKGEHAWQLADWSVTAPEPAAVEAAPAEAAPAEQVPAPVDAAPVPPETTIAP